MSLHVYVMPLWRFKAGDFTSPIEELLGRKATVISLADLPSQRRQPWYLCALERLGFIKFDSPSEEIELTPEQRGFAARKLVAALKRQFSELAGTNIDWPDDGGTYYNQQSGRFAPLQALAAWCDHREQLPMFTVPPESNFYKHPVWALPKPERRRFPTVIDHSLHNGYLLPVPFEGVYRVEPFTIAGHWEFFHSVASTAAMLRELSGLLELISAMPEIQDSESESNPIGEARLYAESLQRICSLSIEHSLPVIFSG